MHGKHGSQTSIAEVADERIKIACVGDSCTYGDRSTDPATKSYPYLLQEKFGKEYHVYNFGVNGATALKKGDKPYWKLEEY